MMTRERSTPGASPRMTGYTLVEVVVVITILSIISLVPGYVVMESSKVYARSAPLLDAAYQCRLAAEWIRRDILDLKDADSIGTMNGSSFSFETSDDKVSYNVVSDRLVRNGDDLVESVNALTFRYFKMDGTSATTNTDLHLVEVDLDVRVGDQDYRTQFTVFPRTFALITSQ